MKKIAIINAPAKLSESLHSLETEVEPGSIGRVDIFTTTGAGCRDWHTAATRHRHDRGGPSWPGPRTRGRPAGAYGSGAIRVAWVSVCEDKIRERRVPVGTVATVRNGSQDSTAPRSMMLVSPRGQSRSVDRARPRGCARGEGPERLRPQSHRVSTPTARSTSKQDGRPYTQAVRR
jgi:hypothetical protein